MTDHASEKPRTVGFAHGHVDPRERRARIMLPLGTQRVRRRRVRPQHVLPPQRYLTKLVTGLRRFLAPALAAAGGLVVAPPSGAATHPTALPDCLGHPHSKPKAVVFACGDGNFGVDHLTWVGWGGSRAIALGSAYLNDCRPYCAAGHFHRYPAILVAGGTQRCPNGEHAYRTVAWAFIGRSPYPQNSPGTTNPRQSFRCGKAS